MERLLGFLEMGRDHVTAETLIQASPTSVPGTKRLSQCPVDSCKRAGVPHANCMCRLFTTQRRLKY